MEQVSQIAKSTTTTFSLRFTFTPRFRFKRSMKDFDEGVFGIGGGDGTGFLVGSNEIVGVEDPGCGEIEGESDCGAEEGDEDGRRLGFADGLTGEIGESAEAGRLDGLIVLTIESAYLDISAESPSNKLEDRRFFFDFFNSWRPVAVAV
jgi:hypothetical protein